MNMIKQYVFAIVAVFLLMLVIPLGVDNFAQHKRVKSFIEKNNSLMVSQALRQLELAGLTVAVHTQNQKIQDFENTSKQMTQARIEAQKQAAQQIKQLSGKIARLELEKVTGCTAEGIRNKILREVLQ